jgi:cytochrome c peroxidase
MFSKARVALVLAVVLALLASSSPAVAKFPSSLDTQLRRALNKAGFTGKAGSSIEKRLGRPVDWELAELGRLLFFDTTVGLRKDNACAGCHSPANGFGDTQSIAIGVQNNNLVGPNRVGPHRRLRATGCGSTPYLRPGPFPWTSSPMTTSGRYLNMPFEHHKDITDS